MIYHLQGYEWNKYNQTHYDHDNPPPKVRITVPLHCLCLSTRLIDCCCSFVQVVQGYKFNIFYPDLIDKSSVCKRLQLATNALLMHTSSPAFKFIGCEVLFCFTMRTQPFTPKFPKSIHAAFSVSFLILAPRLYMFRRQIRLPDTSWNRQTATTSASFASRPGLRTRTSLSKLSSR